MVTSIATIRSPEFINLQPLEISPFISECEIKVLYIGKNRNRSFISKEVATEMAKNLRGSPIVGYYKEENKDFREHSELITFDDDGIHFECLTRPYGFVAPDAKVWFQDFEETDELGQTQIRTYLMTTGYLWTKQFKESQSVISNGKGQSMELDDETIKGHFVEDSDTHIDYFIINDAYFTKLCILGDDIEPCFEGANITAPNISKNFSKDENEFKNTLYTMLKELQYSLKGGNNMDTQENIQAVDTVTIESTDFSATDAATVENVSTEVTSTTEVETQEFAKTDEKSDDEDKEKKDEDYSLDNSEEKNKNEDKNNYTNSQKNEEIMTDKYKKLEAQYNDLLSQFKELQKKESETYSLYNQLMSEKKIDMIDNTFSMIPAELKKEIRDNLDKYSLDDIEAQLSLIGFRNKINFSINETKTKEQNENTVVTFSLNNSSNQDVPEFVQVLKANKKNIN